MRCTRLVSRHRSSVGLRWPSKRIAALHRLPIRSVWAARCALRYAPMAARSLRHLIGDATLACLDRADATDAQGPQALAVDGIDGRWRTYDVLPCHPPLPPLP
ncbi:hypothetical protein [Verminephrobacter eiseniae]|uniref:hypothetical protein n=1 Tax=Verminephrobacter eiseniae TaxID=364317 RepID=UPI002243D745|nr:hypothetical protein [Verminephrobacter eiseniae]